MLDIGVTKLAIIGGIALVVIGPERLPGVARMAGNLLGRARRYMAEVKPSGTVAQHFQSHLTPYWKWIDSGMAMADVQIKQKADQHHAERQAEYQRMRHMLRFQARTPQGRGEGGGTVDSNAVAKSIADFYSRYVHDSFEHFSATGGTLQNDLSTPDYYHLRQLNQPV